MRLRPRRNPAGGAYPFSLGCAAATIVVLVLFLVWLVGWSLR